MIKSPRFSGLNDREFQDFLDNCKLLGFEINFDYPYASIQIQKELSTLVDKVYDDIYDLYFLEECIGRAQDFESGFSTEPVYFQGKKFTEENRKTFIRDLHERQEELRFRIIDTIESYNSTH